MVTSIRNLDKGAYMHSGCVVYKPTKNVAITIKKEDLIPAILGRHDVCASEYFNRNEFLGNLTELSKDSSFKSSFPDAYKLVSGDIVMKLRNGSAAFFAGNTQITDEQSFGDLCHCAVSGEETAGLNVSYRSVVESWVNISQKGLAEVRKVKLRNSSLELYRELFPDRESIRNSLNNSSISKYLTVGVLAGSAIFSMGYLGLSQMNKNAEIQEARQSINEEFIVPVYLHKAENIQKVGTDEDKKIFLDVVRTSEKLKLVPEGNTDLKKLEEIVSNWNQ